MRVSLEKAAKMASGRDRMCAKCPIGFQICVRMGFIDMCDKAFVKGFIKGYKHCKKQQKNDANRV